jgi:MFS family permease
MDFTHGFWMIYLAQKGMSLIQLGFLETIFHITSFAMEIPTGIVADVHGRKRSRILGRVFFLVSMIVLLRGESFLIFAIGFGLAAISYNLETGAGEALVYDSLKEIGKSENYLKVTGNIEGIYQFTGLVSFLVGGYLAAIDYEWLFYLSIAFALLSMVPAALFIEPAYKKVDALGISAIQQFKNITRESIYLIRTNRRVAFLVFSIEFILSIATVLFFYLQNYWKSIGIGEMWIGIFFALSALMGIAGGLLAHRIERFLGQKNFLILLPAATTASLWVIAFTPWHVAAYVMVTFIDSLIFVGLNDFINREIESHIRATVLSMSSMVFSFYMVILFPIFGYISEIVSFQMGFVMLAIVSTLVWLLNIKIIDNNLQ